ncbi:MAG: sulfatase [Candidatus Latescibacterota bacterium]
MNVVCILMDSLNRHFLPAYGNEEVLAPNLRRLARRAVTFDRCFAGSMPCMPARRDLWTGVQEFLWRPWGSLEPWDEPLPRTLRGAGVFTGLVSDHYHLWEAGGENYHVDFETWEFVRGHENDPWAGGPTPEADAGKGQVMPRFRRNRRRFVHEEDWLAPRTLRQAALWLEENAGVHERFFLLVDEFDPHEPFDCPEEHWRRYDPDWQGPADFYWPRYGRNDYTEAEARHIRARYAGKVTLADRYLGKLLDRMDDCHLWDDTALIVMTDHGHFLGEHGWWGKPPCPQYRTISHVPLFVHVPGVPGGTRTAALATHVDVHATILDCLGVPPPRPIDGVSLLPALRGERAQVRDAVVFGWWGRRVNWTDGRHLYLRAPAAPDNQPLAFYTNRWSTAPWWRLPVPDGRTQFGRYMPRVDMPVGRMPVSVEEAARLHNVQLEDLQEGSFLFDLEGDPAEERNLAGTPLEAEVAARLCARMEEQGAPPEQFERLGLR